VAVRRLRGAGTPGAVRGGSGYRRYFKVPAHACRLGAATSTQGHRAPKQEMRAALATPPQPALKYEAVWATTFPLVIKYFHALPASMYENAPIFDAS